MQKLASNEKFSNDGIPGEYHGGFAINSKCYRKLRSNFLISGYSFVQGGYVRGSLGLYHERFLHLISFPNVIHPYSNFFWLWNLFTCIFLASALIYEPYMIAYRVFDYASVSENLFGLFVAIILLMDSFLLFRVGYKDPITSQVVLDPVLIRQSYLHGKFWFNFLTRLPYSSVLFVLIRYHYIEKKSDLTWFRLVPFFVKIMRFEKVYWYMRELTNSFELNTWTSQVTTHGILLIFCLHWGACLHWLLPDVANAFYYEEHGRYKEHSWITKMNLWDKPTGFQYLNTFLRCLANILSLDGGNYVPREYEEIFATVVILLVSVSIVGYYISTISTMALRFEHMGDKHNEIMSSVQEYLRFRKIPMWLRERVMTYFDGKYKGRYLQQIQLLSNVSGNLKTQILKNNCKHLLDNVYLFSELSTAAVHDLMNCLKYEVYIPGDVVLSPDIRMNCIFFIDQGYFGILNEFGTSIQSMEDGDFFGEVDMLCPDIPRKTTVVAMAISRVYQLPRQDYLEFLKGHPNVHEQIMKVVNERLEMEVQRLDKQFNNIDKAARWKEVILQGRKSVADYYAEMDNGFFPPYHIPPAKLQKLMYINYKKEKRHKHSESTANTNVSHHSTSDPEELSKIIV